MSAKSYPRLTRDEVLGPVLMKIKAMVELDEATGCRLWTGGVNAKGYGRVSIKKRSLYVHRITFAIRNGEIPAGMVLDHLCRNPRCCNPDHLEVVSQRTNALRGNSPVATAVRSNRCCRGHEFTPENTYTAAKTGYRQCKTCNYIRYRARMAKRQDAR